MRDMERHYLGEPHGVLLPVSRIFPNECQTPNCTFRKLREFLPCPRPKKKKKSTCTYCIKKKKNLKDTLPTDEKRYELYLTSPQKPSKQDSQVKVSREKKKSNASWRGVI